MNARLLRLAALVGAALAVPASTSAQTVLVRVLDAETSAPLVGAITHLETPQGALIKNALSDERGRSLFIGIPEGSYKVRSEMIGMATMESDVFDVGPGTTVTRELRLESSAIRLEGIEVELEADRCTIRPGGEGALVAQIWDEARKALSAASLTDERGSYRYVTEKYERKIDRGTGVILDEQRSRREGFMSTPFESHPAEDLVEKGFVQRDGQGYLYMAPDATVLLSDPFLDTHCFRITDNGRRHAGLIGLGFEPTGDKKSVPDIAGTMWIDRETAELQWLDFTYEYLDPEMTAPEVGGRVDFQRMPDGTWIVPEWWIRMPVMSAQTDFQGRQRAYIAEYLQTGGIVREVREAGGRSLGQRSETGGVEGFVLDSLGAPLRGVRIGIVGSSQEVYSDAAGAFSITGLSQGRYQIRFVAPQLQDVGYIPPPIERDVIRGELSNVEYHMPSMGDVLFEACRGEEGRDGSSVLAGTVIDGLGRPVANASVRAQWTGYNAVGGGRIDETTVTNLREQLDGFEATTGPAGAFSFCGLPAGQRIRLYAETADAASQEFEVVIPTTEVGAMRVIELQRKR